jgi:hypothetical protein
MDVPKDFRDLLALFNAHGVEYVVVGAYALAFHGAPRFTGDMDILVRPSSNNAQSVLAALAEFGFQFPNLTADDFQKPDMVIQLGVPPVRIDLITAISGVTWEEAAAQKEPGLFGDVPVHFLGRRQYIQNKLAAGRRKDLADLEALGEL